jgi:TonB family protein
MSEIHGLTEAILPLGERRVHERRRVSLAYIDLGENNGGIVLNVSEGGLAATAVEVFHGTYLPKIRFQLPHSNTHIEARGQIAWTGESKREVGVQFVDLSAEATAEIRSWIASEYAGEATSGTVRQQYPSENDAARGESYAGETASGTVQQQYPSERDAAWRESYAAEGDLSSTGITTSEPTQNSTETSSDRLTPAEEVTHTSVRRPFTAIMAPGILAREPAGLELKAPKMPTPDLRCPELTAPEVGAAEIAGPEMRVPEPIVPTMTTEEMRAHVPVIQVTATLTAPDVETAAPVTETSAPEREKAAIPTEAAAHATEMMAAEAAPMVPTPAPAIKQPQGAQTQSRNNLATGRSFAVALQNTRAPVESAPLVHSSLGLRVDPQIFYQAPALSYSGEFDAPHRRWWVLTALISLFAVISFVAGIAAGGGGWDGVLRLAGGKATPAGEPERAGDSAAGTAAEAAAGGKPASAAPGAENTSARAADAKSGGRGSAAERAASSSSGRPRDNENSSIVLSMPESSVSASASVAITSRRSVHVTQESAPKSALQGGSVQIGQLFYRIEPFYPPDAERQGIEGEVEVHAVVGRDGKVRTAEAVSGPAALSETAVKAVREWRYKPTTVNGQPIESEVNVKMTFRLPRDKNTPQ